MASIALLSPQLQRSIDEKKHILAAVRYVEALLGKLQVVSDGVRAMIAAEENTAFGALVTAQGVQWHDTAATICHSEAEYLQLESEREAALRRYEGLSHLERQRDDDVKRMLQRFAEGHKAKTAHLVSEVETTVQDQMGDVSHLPEGDGWVQQQTVLRHACVLRRQKARTLQHFQRCDAAALEIAQHKWNEEIASYTERSRSRRSIHILLSMEERTRGRGTPWREVWWHGCRQLPPGRLSVEEHSVDPHVRGIEGAEAMERFGVACRFVLLGRCVEYLEATRAERMEDLMDVWLWMYEERRHIERKEMKAAERCERNTMYGTEWEDLYATGGAFLAASETKVRFVMHENIQREWATFEAERARLDGFVWFFHGVQYYERKLLLSEEEATRLFATEDASRSTVSAFHEGGFIAVLTEELLGRHVVQLLDTENESHAVRCDVECTERFERDVLLTEEEGRVVLMQARYVAMARWAEDFLQLCQWCARKNCLYNSMLTLTGLQHGLLAEHTSVLDEVHRGLLAYERWEGLLHLQRRAVAADERVCRFPYEEEAASAHLCLVQEHEVMGICDINHYNLLRIERAAFADTEAVVRWQGDDSALARGATELEEEWAWRMLRVARLADLHHIERAALSDVESVFRWQVEKVHTFTLAAKEEGLAFAVLLQDEVDQRNEIDRRHLMLKEDVLRWRLAALESCEQHTLSEHSARLQLLCGFVAELHIIERRAFVEVESAVRWQLAEEGCARGVVEHTAYHGVCLLVCLMVQEKKTYERIQFVRGYLLERTVQEEDVLRSAASEAADVHLMYLKACEREQLRGIELRAFAEVEQVVRYQGEVSRDKGLHQVACLQEADLLGIEQRHHLHTIERAALQEVETVLRWQLDVELEKFAKYHAFNRKCSESSIDHVRRTHALQKWEAEKAHRVSRHLVETEAQVAQVELEEHQTWHRMCTAMHERMHRMQREAFDEHAMYNLTVLSGFAYMEYLEDAEPLCFELLRKTTHYRIFLVERKALCTVEEHHRHIVELELEQQSIHTEEVATRLAMNRALMLAVQHTARQEFFLLEDRHRHEMEGEQHSRGMVQVQRLCEVLSQHSAFLCACNAIQVKELVVLEQLTRIDLEEGLLRRHVRSEAREERVIMFAGFYEAMRDVQYTTLCRVERERRTTLSESLIAKWEKFAAAIQSTIKVFGKKDAMHAARCASLLLDAEEGVDVVMQEEDDAYDLLLRTLRTTMVACYREHHARLFIREQEARSRISLPTVHTFVLYHHYDKYRQNLQHIEDEETKRYLAWRESSKGGLLRLMRAAPVSVRGTNLLTGLKLLSRCVFPRKTRAKAKEADTRPLPTASPLSSPLAPTTSHLDVAMSPGATSQASGSSLPPTPSSMMSFSVLSSPGKKAEVFSFTADVMQKVPVFEARQGEALDPAPRFRVRDMNGIPLIYGVEFKVANKTAKVTHVRPLGTDWVVTIVPLKAGVYTISLTVSVSDTEILKPLPVSVSQMRPDNVSEQAWRLYKLLEGKEGGVDGYLAASGANGNKQVSMIHDQVAPSNARGGRLSPIRSRPRANRGTQVQYVPAPQRRARSAFTNSSSTVPSRLRHPTRSAPAPSPTQRNGRNAAKPRAARTHPARPNNASPRQLRHRRLPPLSRTA